VPLISLITGGARSGKSRHALELGDGYAKRTFIATAEPIDDEMRARIDAHVARRGESWITVEEPLDLAGAVGDLGHDVDVAVIDCVTVWLGNLLHHVDSPAAVSGAIDAFIETLADPPCDLIVVTNEVGAGIVPATPLGRRFRDLAGETNQRMARAADRVVVMFSGIPVLVKAETS